MIDLAEIETTDAEVMTEVEEEMNGEILAEIIVETSAAETTDVAMTGITALEDMTGEILMETMIGIVQNAIIPTLLEEWNVTDVVLQSQVVETLVVEIQTVEILAEETSETEILDVEILAEETSETGILDVEIRKTSRRDSGTGPGLEKRFLQIMIGPAKYNNSNFSFRKECNRCGEPKSGNSGGGNNRGRRDSQPRNDRPSRNDGEPRKI